jgi:hypothetical protein
MKKSIKKNIRGKKYKRRSKRNYRLKTKRNYRLRRKRTYKKGGGQSKEKGNRRMNDGIKQINNWIDSGCQIEKYNLLNDGYDLFKRGWNDYTTLYKDNLDGVTINDLLDKLIELSNLLNLLTKEIDEKKQFESRILNKLYEIDNNLYNFSEWINKNIKPDDYMSIQTRQAVRGLTRLVGTVFNKINNYSAQIWGYTKSFYLGKNSTQENLGKLMDNTGNFSGSLTDDFKGLFSKLDPKKQKDLLDSGENFLTAIDSSLPKEIITFLVKLYLGPIIRTFLPVSGINLSISLDPADTLIDGFRKLGNIPGTTITLLSHLEHIIKLLSYIAPGINLKRVFQLFLERNVYNTTGSSDPSALIVNQLIDGLSSPKETLAAFKEAYNQANATSP